MKRLHYIHWSEEEIAERAERIRALGYRVDCDPVTARGFRAAFRRDPADLVIIDLSRLPSHGREVAAWLTDTRATAHIPLVFLEGQPDKVARVREQFPRAQFATWQTLSQTVERAAASAPMSVDTDRKFGTQPMAGYSGTPLPKKLGMRNGTRVRLVTPPDDFEQTLGTLPPGARLLTSPRARCDLIIWFPRDRESFVTRLPKLADQVPEGGIWIAWRKKSSGVASDLSSAIIRDGALDAGLVDYKVCAIDAVWSGLKFAVRRESDGF